jgi:hypothetical protein
MSSTSEGDIVFQVRAGGQIKVQSGAELPTRVPSEEWVGGIETTAALASTAAELATARIRRIEGLLGASGPANDTATEDDFNYGATSLPTILQGLRDDGALTRALLSSMLTHMAAQKHSWSAKSPATSMSTGGGTVVVSGHGFIAGQTVYTCRFTWRPEDGSAPIVVSSATVNAAKTLANSVECAVPAWPKELITQPVWSSTVELVEGNPGVVVPCLDQSLAAASFVWTAHGPLVEIENDLVVVECRNGAKKCPQPFDFDVTDEDSDPDLVKVTVDISEGATCFDAVIDGRSVVVSPIVGQAPCSGRVNLTAVDTSGATETRVVSVKVRLDTVFTMLLKASADEPADYTVASGQSLSSEPARPIESVDKGASQAPRIKLNNAACWSDAVSIIMIHQAQGTAAVAGLWELAGVAKQDYVGGHCYVTLTRPLKNAYLTSYDPNAMSAAQAVPVHTFNNLVVEGAISPAGLWDDQAGGPAGGVVAIVANTVTVKSGGTVKADGAGFRPGLGQCARSDYTWGQIGESTSAKPGRIQSAPWSLGTMGGGGNGQGGGCGGGHVENGGSGSCSGCCRSGCGSGFAFPSIATVAMTDRVVFGGGGGAAGSHNGAGRCGTNGGRSGGIVVIVASGDVVVHVAGAVSADGGQGANGVQSSQSAGGGGGGSGGSVLIASTTSGAQSVPVLAAIQVAGGTGGGPSPGTCGPAGNGGTGSPGRKGVENGVSTLTFSGA